MVGKHDMAGVGSVTLQCRYVLEKCSLGGSDLQRVSVSSLSSDLTKAHNVRHFRTSLDMPLLYFEKVCSPFLRHLSRRCWRWGSAGPPSLSPSHSRAQSENIVTCSDYVLQFPNPGVMMKMFTYLRLNSLLMVA